MSLFGMVDDHVRRQIRAADPNDPRGMTREELVAALDRLVAERDRLAEALTQIAAVETNDPDSWNLDTALAAALDEAQAIARAAIRETKERA